MKKVLYSIAVVLLAVCCAKEEPRFEGGSKVFSAVIPETRTALGDKSGETYPNLWVAGDKISVNGVASAELDSSNGAGTNKAGFSVEGVTAPYNYAYPAAAVSAYTGTSATITIPTAQAYVAGNYDPAAWIMVGSGSSETLSFSPAMALLKITPAAPASGTLQVASVKVEAIGSEKLSGAFTTDFATITAATGAAGHTSVTPSAPVDFGTSLIVAIPAQTYASGMRITITASDDSFMIITRPGSWDVLANKLYTVNAPAYTPNSDVLPLSVGTVSSSSISYVWGAGTYKGAYGHDYTAALYTDAACENLLVSYSIPASGEVWGIEDGDVYPAFSFGGLAPSTSYYCKVTDNTTGAVSTVVEGTTSAFTVVNPSSVTDAVAGDILLAEDFSEIGWGPDEFGNAAGFVPNPKALGTPTGVNPEGSFHNYKSTSAGRIFDDSVTPMTASHRLHDWGFQGSNSFYIRDGYLRCSTTSSRTHLVTPSLNGIPAGKYAVVDVTVTAAKHEDSTNDVAVFVAPGDATRDGYKYTGISLTDGTAFGITSSRTWETRTVRLSNVAAGSRLVIGSLENMSNLNRFSISDIEVQLVSVSDSPVTFDITASLIGASSSSLAFEWDDNTRDYVAALYSDIDCTSLVCSYEIPADENHWVKASNAQASPWNGAAPKFVFAGLAPATTYYLKVTSGTLSSNVVQATTSAFTVVDATKVTNAAAGDVILAEDFSEIGFGSDEFFGTSGFYPSTKALGAASGAYTVADGNYHIPNANNVRLYDITTIGSADRLSAWGFLGNSATYAYAGYLRVGASSSGNRTHIVSPALSGIPDGKKATVDVTVTSSIYESSENDVAVFAKTGLGSTDLAKGGHKFSGASLTDGYALNASVKSWTTRTVRINNVTRDHHLIFGSLKDVDTKNRFFLNDVVVTVVEIKTPGAIEDVIEIKDFDSFKAYLEACAAGQTVQGNVTANVALTPAQEAEIASLYPVDSDGIVNGGGFTISGLTKPLFNVLSGPVSNLTLQSDINITAAQGNVGIFAKTVDGTSLTNCIAKGSVTLTDAVAVSGDLYIGGLAGAASGASFTGCENQAPIASAAGVSSVLCIGGIAGMVDGTTFVSCCNNGSISNTGAAGGDPGARIGGLAGSVTGASDLSGDTNYNKAPISDTSDSGVAAVGGVCGYADNAAASFASAQNKAEGAITIGGTKTAIMVGGILGQTVASVSIGGACNAGAINISGMTVTYVRCGGILGVISDDAVPAISGTAAKWTENSGPVKFTGCTISGQLTVGGIFGAWENGETYTIQYCKNSGSITTNTQSTTSEDICTAAMAAYCYVGGIGTCTNSDGAGKTFTHCQNTGDIKLYLGSKTRLGGITGNCKISPSYCDVDADLTLGWNRKPASGESNAIGGIFGTFFSKTASSTFTNLFYNGTIDATGITHNNIRQYVSGFGAVNPTTASITVNWVNCKIGGAVKTKSNSGYEKAGLFTGTNQGSGDSNAAKRPTMACTNCEVLSGTNVYRNGDNIITSDNPGSNLLVGNTGASSSVAVEGVSCVTSIAPNTAFSPEHPAR